MSHKNNFFEKLLSEDDMQQINNAVTTFNSENNIELEIGFKRIDYPNYIRIAESLINSTDQTKILESVSLDAIILLGDGNSYRVSFQTQELIDKFFDKIIGSKLRLSNQDIQRYLINIKLNTPNIEIMYKNKGSATMIQPEDLDIIFKLTKETPVETKPELSGNEKLLFRLKQRYSFTINKSVRIDVTQVQQSNNIFNLTSQDNRYEVELEVINKKITTKELLTETYTMLKIVQDTSIPISKTESQQVISEYRKLSGDTKGIHLEKRSTISIESQHIVDFIPNNYAPTDKADGNRRFLVSLPMGLYLLTNNLIVTKLDMKIDNPEYHNMILDGENDDSEEGNMLLLFDIVYFNQVNYKYNTKFNLNNRVTILNDIIDKCFGNLIPFANYTDKHTDLELDKILKFYTMEFKKYWKEFRNRLAVFKKKSELFITRKVYLFPLGIDKSEVFAYADLIWKLFVYKSLPPYRPDGIIYAPLTGPYLIKVSRDLIDSVPLEYKWKEPNQNSIDFYIVFNKDSNGVDIILYDQSTKSGTGKPYKVARLFVGGFNGSNETPIPFKVNGTEQKAYIYAQDGVARDSSKRAIDDKTVVEFIYDYVPEDNTKIDSIIQETDNGYKWIPLKTRYDKTESVTKYQKMYGNPNYIAQRIYRSIVNPITETTISLLANPNSFQKEFDRLGKSVAKIEINKPTVNRLISAQANTNFSYYQGRTNIGKGMRAYHNWIKSNMIITYCKNKESVLDIGVGRGGDINKFILANVSEVVGIDVDNNGLYVSEDCASYRYRNAKKKNPKIPNMSFINANAKGLFNVKSQEKIIPDMNDNNKKLIQEKLSGNKKYNVINCQFSLHYYLSDETSWKNFCKNINDHAMTNAYFLITTFDGKIIKDKLGNKSKLTISYTNNSGNKTTFVEINKLYTDTDKSNLGQAINLYNSTISKPGTYITEYLVDPDFLIASLKKNCGMELVETDLFFNMFNLYKKYFSRGVSDLDSSSDTKQYEIISNYYKTLNPEFQNLFTTEEIEMNKASFAFSSLNRYFVFKKKVNVDFDEPSRIVGINNRINLNKFITPYFHSNQMIIDVANISPRVQKLYSIMKKMYLKEKPSIYLIRHSIIEDQIRNEIYRRNKIELAKIKDGLTPNMFLVYKSPDKFFYPIYQITCKQDKYLFTNQNIISDLDILVALTDKINRM